MMSVSYHWDMPRWLGDTYIGDSEVLEKIMAKNLDWDMSGYRWEMRMMGMPHLSKGVRAALEECNAPESRGTDLQGKSAQV